MTDPRIAELAPGFEEIARSNGSRSGRQSMATILVGLASEHAELFHATDGKTYARIEVDDHLETHPVRGRHFRTWLSRLGRQITGSTPGGQALADAVTNLDGEAQFGGDQHTVSVRLGGDDTAVYLDTGDAFVVGGRDHRQRMADRLRPSRSDASAERLRTAARSRPRRVALRAAPVRERRGRCRLRTSRRLHGRGASRARAVPGAGAPRGARERQELDRARGPRPTRSEYGTAPRAAA